MAVSGLLVEVCVQKMKIILVLLLLDYSSGFSMIDARPGLLVAAPGDRVTLSCTVDDHYEWCKFYHPGGGECDFEWKRSQNNITMQMCDMANRVSFTSFFSLHYL